MQILRDIKSFLIEETSVEKLLYLLPQSREGVGLIAHGLFSENETIQKMTA
jgi:hypothetical protein